MMYNFVREVFGEISDDIVITDGGVSSRSEHPTPEQEAVIRQTAANLGKSPYYGNINSFYATLDEIGCKLDEIRREHGL